MHYIECLVIFISTNNNDIMATLKNTIKKAEKLSGQNITVSRNNEHSVNYKGYSISFFPNGRMSDDVEATNFYAKKLTLTDDITTDYFSGSFHPNIKKAFDLVDYLTK